MIKSVIIRNFQSHRKTILRLHKGVNIIIGESDAGKSAIVKALRLLINNRPTGTEFITHKKKNVSVKINVDGKVVERRKGRKNLYSIDGEEFKGFGQSVPEPVSKLLNISDVNIHQQLDTPFLLSESPGEVARYFNRIVNLDIIDRSLTNIRNAIREEGRQLSLAKEEKKRLGASLKDYDWVKHAEDDLAKLEKTQSTVNRLSKQMEDISYVIVEIERALFKKKKFSKLSESRREVERLVALNKEIKKEYQEYEELALLIQKIESAVSSKKVKTKEKEKLERDLAELMPDICPLCKQEIR